MDISASESAEHGYLKRLAAVALGPTARFEVVIGRTKFDVVSEDRKLAVECQASLMSADEFYERCNDAEDAGLDLWWVLGRRNYGHLVHVGEGLFLRLQNLEHLILKHQGLLLYHPLPSPLPLFMGMKVGQKKWAHGNGRCCETLRFLARKWLSGLPAADRMLSAEAWEVFLVEEREAETEGSDYARYALERMTDGSYE
jgi:hypothetical protein